jgi:hypothetical protein
MKKFKVITATFFLLTSTGIAATIINYKYFATNVYFNKNGCKTLDLANTAFTTTGVTQATIRAEDGTIYNLYRDANCTQAAYLIPCP